ncbi:MAG: hypothetical protein FJ184_06440 [Gammaproteobacteria bacterium]|nr:hypothetical protein [Gammaproteobacteria bacterium]
MNNVGILKHEFSEVFWNKIFSHGAVHLSQVNTDITANHAHFEKLRANATYNTGSVPVASAVTLAMAANYFQPSLIAEIGTFIGRSTFSLALGSYLGGVTSPQIHTCDYSNDIELGFNPPFDGIKQYKKTGSTEMLLSLASKELKPEMYFFDGRLQDNDITLLSKLDASRSIVLLDDFEGTEKGVANAFKLNGFFKNQFMVAYPPTGKILESFGLLGWCTVAALIPIDRVAFA